MSRLLAPCLVLALGASCRSKSAAPQPTSGDIEAMVESAPGVPAAACVAVLEGSPLSSRCSPAGAISFKRVPPGTWVLRVTIEGESGVRASQRELVAVNAGLLTDEGSIIVGRPGSIAGVVDFLPDSPRREVIVTVAEGNAVRVPAGGTAYWIPDVPAGTHEVALWDGQAMLARGSVRVTGGRTTVGVDLDLAGARAGQAVLRGQVVATRPGPTRLELVSVRDGLVAATGAADDQGRFALTAPAGVYLLRAVQEGNPVTVILRGVILHPDRPFALQSPVLMLGSADDLDGDGLAGDRDDDDDGDGVPDARDAFPFDPLEWEDGNRDGLGDRSSPEARGGPPPTPAAADAGSAPPPADAGAPADLATEAFTGGVVDRDLRLPAGVYALRQLVEVRDGATLTLDPGVELRGDFVGIVVRRGRLVAVGGPAKILVQQTITFETLATAMLKRVRVEASIEDGAHPGALDLDELEVISVTTPRSPIRNTVFLPQDVPPGAGAPEAIRVSADALHLLGPGNTYNGGVVLVTGAALRESRTWLAQDTEVRVVGDVLVEGAAAAAGPTPVLTLQAGLTLRFGKNPRLASDTPAAGLRVGVNGPGALIAQGTPSARVVFTGVDRFRGSWPGVLFGPNTAAGCELQHAEVSFGGTAQGAITFDRNPVPVRVRSAFINNGGGWGIWDAGLLPAILEEIVWGTDGASNVSGDLTRRN